MTMPLSEELPEPVKESDSDPERVLEEAENKKVPLCERLNFAAIYQSNLDEFFMVRVGSLVDQMLLKKDIRDNKTNLTPEEQIKKILAESVFDRTVPARNAVYPGFHRQMTDPAVPHYRRHSHGQDPDNDTEY